tara:strand:- start:380 stop:670 length:291 start_codon:yes stop_codon:yes gene_type:complete
VYEVFAQAWYQDRIEFVEDFKVMFLSRAKRVLGIVNISSGGTAGTVISTLGEQHAPEYHRKSILEGVTCSDILMWGNTRKTAIIGWESAKTDILEM